MTIFPFFDVSTALLAHRSNFSPATLCLLLRYRFVLIFTVDQKDEFFLFLEFGIYVLKSYL